MKKQLCNIAQGTLDIQILEDIVAGDYTAQQASNLIKFAEKEKILHKLHQLYAAFEKEKEVRIVQHLLTDPKLNWRTLYPLPEKYTPMVTEEIKKLNLSEKDHLAITGSGSFPATAISFSDRTAAKITCIEKVPRYADLCKKVLRKLGYDQKINVICGKAEEVSYADYTAILLTMLTQNKAMVLQKIADTNMSNCKTVVRRAQGIIRLIYP